MKVCYLAGREASYSRTHNILTALRNGGFEVETCLPPDKAFRHYPGLITEFLRKKRGCDLVVVGFYGQLLLPFVRLLTRKPILFDVYISTFGTMVNDREAADATSWKAKLYWLFDHLSMRMADRIILETHDHILGYERDYRVSRAKFEQMFLPTDERLIFPRAGESSFRAPSNNGKFLVHFHGEYAPFHGVQYIIRAAKLLEKENVHFQIIGKGITYERDRKLADDLHLQNITFIDWVPYRELADYMCRADACLGIFGDNPRTLRVLTNKVIETIAVKRPLISAKNAPVQELLEDGESALLVERANPDALANAIRMLKNDPALRARIAENGHQVFLNHCTQQVFAKRLKTIIEEMVRYGSRN